MRLWRRLAEGRGRAERSHRGRGSYPEGLVFSVLSFGSVAVGTLVSGIVTARIYGIEVIGEFALTLAPSAGLVVFSSLREQAALGRELAQLQPRAPRVLGLFLPVLAFSTVLTLVVGAIVVLITWLAFSGPIDRPHLFAPAVALLGANLVLFNPGWNLEVVFSSFRAGRSLFWIGVTQQVTYTALAVGLSFAGKSVWALIAATAGSWLAALAHRLVSVRAFMPLSAPFSEIRDGFRSLRAIVTFGAKAAPGTMADGLSGEGGTWVVGAIAPVAAVGAYSRAGGLAARTRDINIRVNGMLFPTLVERSGSDAAGFDRALVDTSRYSIVGLLALAAAGGGASDGIMDLFGPGFDQGAAALAILLLASPVAALVDVHQSALWAVNRPLLTSAIAVTRAVFTLAATVVLTSLMSITGTALAFLLGYLLSAGWYVASTRRHMSARWVALWPYRNMLSVAVAYAAGVVVGRIVDAGIGGLAGVALAFTAATLAFAAIFLLTGGLLDRDRARLQRVARRLSSVAPTRVRAET